MVISLNAIDAKRDKDFIGFHWCLTGILPSQGTDTQLDSVMKSLTAFHQLVLCHVCMTVL